MHREQMRDSRALSLQEAPMIPRRLPPSTLPLALLLLAAPGCRRAAPLHATQVEAPPGEVWMTPAQLKEGQVVVANVQEEAVDDTILTSGKVTFDDARVSHVFSPVAGRVVRIDTALGASWLEVQHGLDKGLRVAISRALMLSSLL